MLLQKKTKVAELRESDRTTVERKTKVHAQRKFAQGSPNFTIIREKEKEKENGSVCHTNSSTTSYNDSTNDVILDVCPKTEDFLEFLCFRSCPDILPSSLSFFGDPKKHNFPNGVPKTDLNTSSLPSKQEIGSKAETKNVESRVSTISKQKPHKAPSQIKKIPTLSKTKLAVGRIHSSFRRTNVNSGMITRMGRLKTCPELPAPKITKMLNSKHKKLLKNSSPLPKRVSTRSQIHRSQVKSSSSSSSSNEDSDSEETYSDHKKLSRSPSKQRKVLLSKKKLIVKTVPSRLQTVKHKKPTRNQEKLFSLPVSRNTRLSVAKSSQKVPDLSLARKVVKEQVKASSVTVRRKSSVVEMKDSPSKEKPNTPVSSSVSNASTVPTKMTREATKKLKNLPQKIVSSPVRRPSRRTKEAATFFMTLIGQEEEFYSSELEEQLLRSLKEEDKEPPKKKIRVPNGRKTENRSSSPSVLVRTRRSGNSVSASPAKRRATILQEAAKRFTASQSSSSESSEEEEDDDSSSSSSEEEVPVRSIRTRSFDPTQVSKSLSCVAKPAEDTRKTRATATRKKPSEPTESVEVKIPFRNESKKLAKVTPEKSDIGTRKRSVTKRTAVTPPLSYDLSSLIEAPVFHPNEKEFNDPLEYLEKIRPECERFGICRIVPPSSFKPECQVTDAMRFTAHNQYIHRMFRRRGSNSRILEAIHLHLRGLNIDYQPAPCIGGIEVDLPGLYQAVQDLGGPGHVLENNLWSKVSDMLKIPRTAQDRLSKLDTIYCKYLLPYATLSDDERKKLLQKVDSTQYRRSTDDEDEDECVVKGSSIPLSTFYRIARNTLAIWFPNANTSATDASVLEPAQVEATYWKLVTARASHVCVYSGNIDSGQAGYGFPCNKTSRHPWNLKVLTNNNGSVLRSLGPVAGCTAPTLHVSMLFSASCWYRDPHGLPWIDYLHTGADKIWYGVPSLQEPVLHQAMAKLVPDLVKSNKSVWLTSDTVMVPPTMLADEGVSLSRTVQKSGQFVVVWPRAFTSSLSTGYSVSESVYFAPLDWLPIGDSCFKELRINQEPTVFSLQQLLWNIAHDSRSTVDVLKRVLPILQPGIDEEIQLRSSLRDFGVQQWEKLPRASETTQRGEGKKRRQPSTTDDGDMECEVCQASLFFSRAECHAQAESPVTWCLMHAFQKIKDRPRVTQHIRVFYVHEEDELRQTLQSIQESIKTKSLRRTACHQRSSTL